jgi:oxygen-independent coproporphyrinogen-3 oxidase
MRQTDHINLQWLRKYSRPGPRYTSYPTAPVFHSGFTERDYIELLSNPAQRSVPLSFYFHIPYCESVCYFCACNVIYTRNRGKVDPYLDLVLKEMDLLKKYIDPVRRVDQLHWGGGTPTFLTPDRMDRFYSAIEDRFTFNDGAEISVELDPREITDEHLEILRKHGFNRGSLGIQDVDPRVQEAVNRIQPLELVTRIYDQMRSRGFAGINFDLIYGLPYQTPDSFERTIDAVVELRPDRISLFNFAYLPHLKKHQTRLNASALPDTETRLAIFARAVNRFIEAGYVYIGMDHFALPDDELCVSQNNGTLHRNFQGYTTRGGCDLIGVGLTSIGELSGGYAQNYKKLDEYTAAIESGNLPIERGYHRTQEDALRHRVIMGLISHFHMKFDKFKTDTGVDFRSHFDREMEELKGFADDGLLTIDDDGIDVPFQGRFVIRNICMVFDAHLSDLESRGQKFSKTV